ncbi:MAG: aspartate kinase [Candidatus Bathyarchaeia archaeon]
MRVIVKFGGTSLSDGKRIRSAAELIKKYKGRIEEIAVVASAMGGVTDELIRAAERAKAGDRAYVEGFLEGFSRRHLDAIEEAISDQRLRADLAERVRADVADLGRALIGVSYLSELTPRSRDYILSFGERLSTRILCGALQDLGMRAEYFTGFEAGIITDANFGEAAPIFELAGERVREALDGRLRSGSIPVVTGFIGGTAEGIVTTLGRGGSDYTATILGALLNADEVWLMTDVNGLMTADPKIVPSAKTIGRISYSEAAEMAFFGAKSLHPRALEPVSEKGIPLRIRNTFDPEGEGTLITKGGEERGDKVVKAVTLIRNVSLITVGGAGIVGAPGAAAKILKVLGDNRINVLMISQSSSEYNISFVIPRASSKGAVSALRRELKDEGLVREVTSEDDVCVVAAVGAGMRGTPGVAARVFTAVAKKGINVRMIAQGSSELNISFVVGESDGAAAVRAIHEEFSLGS